MLVGGKLHAGQHLGDLGDKKHPLSTQLLPNIQVPADKFYKTLLEELVQKTYMRNMSEEFNSATMKMWVMNPLKTVNIAKPGTATDHILNSCQLLDSMTLPAVLPADFYIVVMPNDLVDFDPKLKVGSSVAHDAVWASVQETFVCAAEVYMRCTGSTSSNSSSSSSRSSQFAETPAISSLQAFSFTGRTAVEKLVNLRRFLEFCKLHLPADSFDSVLKCEDGLKSFLAQLSALSHADLLTTYSSFPEDIVSCGDWRRTHASFDPDPATDRSASSTAYRSAPVYTVLTRTVDEEQGDTVEEERPGETRSEARSITNLESLCGKAQVQCTAPCGTEGLFETGMWFLLQKVVIKDVNTIYSDPTGNYLVVFSDRTQRKHSFPCTQFIEGDPVVEV